MTLAPPIPASSHQLNSTPITSYEDMITRHDLMTAQWDDDDRRKHDLESGDDL
jgi:hypothetical protein